jgi:hypothetical protein
MTYGQKVFGMKSMINVKVSELRWRCKQKACRSTCKVVVRVYKCTCKMKSVSKFT